MKKRILILAPHTDDGEIGCGGSIARYLEDTPDVFYLAASTCKRSLPDGWPPDTLEKEVKNATKTLGISEKNLVLLDYDVRVFTDHRQQILEDLVKLRNTTAPRPTVAFSPITVFCKIPAFGAIHA